MEVTAERIAQHFNGEIIGDPTVKVSSVAKIEQGKPGNICFLANFALLPDKREVSQPHTFPQLGAPCAF